METYHITVINPDGSEDRLEIPAGWQVMEALRDHGYPVKAECGGACCCATCHVYVAEEWLGRIPPMGDDEEAMLDSALALQENSRLSCQLVMNADLDGLRVAVAPNGV